VERLTLLDGQAQPEGDRHHSGQPVERPASARRERRNRARELRQQAREEEEHLRVAGQALP
jgi:hypothetical protein